MMTAMNRLILTPAYLRKLRGLATGVAKQRESESGSVSALREEITPIDLVEHAIEKSSVGEKTLSIETVYGYRSCLRRLARVLKRPDAGEYVRQTIEESHEWYTVPEVRARFLASMTGDLGGMAKVLDAAAARIDVRACDRVAVSPGEDPISADNALIQLGEPRYGSPSPVNVRNYRREHVPIHARDVRMLRDSMRRGVHPLHVAFPSRDRTIPEHLEIYMGALSGMLMEATWLTGLRPIEWCGASIEVQHADGRTISMSAAIQSLMASSDLPDRTSQPRDWLVAVRDLFDRPLDFGTPWLVLRNAKVTKAIEKKLPTDRALEIERLPASAQICIWCVAEIFRETWGLPPDTHYHAWRDAERKEAEKRLSCASIRIRRMVERALPEYPDTLTLRTLRRDFGDRCKAVMDQEAVAVAMGHTAVRSQDSYGRGVQRLQGSAPRHPKAYVVPHPDLVETFVASLKARRARERAPSRQIPLWELVNVGPESRLASG